MKEEVRGFFICILTKHTLTTGSKSVFELALSGRDGHLFGIAGLFVVVFFPERGVFYT